MFSYAPFSSKQLEVITSELSRITILEGSVSSGKTICSIIRWVLYVGLETSPNAKLLMIGVTQDTLKRNVINDLLEIVGDKYAKYRDGELTLFGRTIYCVGARDEGQEKRIRGLSVEGCYVDEATQIPENVLEQAIIRCRKGKGKLLWTTNPDSPYHYLHKKFVGNQKDIGTGRIRVFHFNLDDNLALSEEYKNDLKANFTGLWYKRMILGLWVIAEGIICDKFNLDIQGFDDSDMPEKFDTVSLTLDYGTQNPLAALLAGQANDSETWVFDEYYYSGREMLVQKSDMEYGQDLQKFIENHPPERQPERTFMDPSAASMKAELVRIGFEEVIEATNDVLPGIKTVSSRLAAGKIKIHRTNCPNLVREFLSYCWDEKAAKKGEDKPLKKHDHALDALRYHEHTVFGSEDHNFVSPIIHQVGENSMDITDLMAGLGGLMR